MWASTTARGTERQRPRQRVASAAVRAGVLGREARHDVPEQRVREEAYAVDTVGWGPRGDGGGEGRGGRDGWVGDGIVRIREHHGRAQRQWIGNVDAVELHVAHADVDARLKLLLLHGRRRAGAERSGRGAALERSGVAARLDWGTTRRTTLCSGAICAVRSIQGPSHRLSSCLAITPCRMRLGRLLSGCPQSAAVAIRSFPSAAVWPASTCVGLPSLLPRSPPGSPRSGCRAAQLGASEGVLRLARWPRRGRFPVRQLCGARALL
ncbi:unnamed protein product [Miscanthus lutarioriparius]|uniref:Uncharacterized protein n=1 Tax=Miscanthus lutarioriparius TaxID=422564 RepID=A0A811SIH1_9POAL|nr:unnamed protein product [Miscanthus lutarioriparius]